MRRPMRKPWLRIMNYSQMTRNFRDFYNTFREATWIAMHGIAWNPITSVCYLRLLAAGNFLEFQAIPWISLHSREFHAILSNLMQFHELPWNIMECHRHPWKSKGFYGSPWNSMEFYGIPWNSMEWHEIP